MRKLLLLLPLALGACQTDADLRPANYDELALATGHWEWLSTSYPGGTRPPATEGYARQLLFGASHELTLRRAGRPDYRTTYQLAMAPLPACNPATSVPTITYSTSEADLGNNDRHTYSIRQQNGRQLLSLRGEAACADGGACETYYWVPD